VNFFKKSALQVFNYYVYNTSPADGKMKKPERLVVVLKVLFLKDT
jgi:hypothetical protein